MPTLEELILGREEEEEEEDEDKKEHPLAYKPISVDTAKEVGSGLKGMVEGGLRNIAQDEEGRNRSYGESFIEGLKTPYYAGKVILGGMLKTVKEGIEDPRKAVAPVLQTAGAAAGALTGGPLAAVGGSIAGRALGEVIESKLLGRPVLNAESALETTTAGFGSIIGTTAGGAARGVLRAKGIIKDTPGVVKTTIERTVQQPAEHAFVDQIINIAEHNTNKVRQQMYDDIAKENELPAYMDESARTLPEGLVRPDVDVNDPEAIIKDIRARHNEEYQSARQALVDEADRTWRRQQVEQLVQLRNSKYTPTPSPKVEKILAEVKGSQEPHIEQAKQAVKLLKDRKLRDKGLPTPDDEEALRLATREFEDPELPISPDVQGMYEQALADIPEEMAKGQGKPQGLKALRHESAMERSIDLTTANRIIEARHKYERELRTREGREGKAVEQNASNVTPLLDELVVTAKKDVNWEDLATKAALQYTGGASVGPSSRWTGLRNVHSWQQWEQMGLAPDKIQQLVDADILVTESKGLRLDPRFIEPELHQLKEKGLVPADAAVFHGKPAGPTPTRIEKMEAARAKALRAQAEELRLANDSVLKKLPDWTQHTMQEFKRILAVGPEWSGHPMVKYVTKFGNRFGVLPSIWRADSVLRKQNNGFLTHIAEVNLRAEELHTSFGDAMYKLNDEIFDKYKITDEDDMYLLALDQRKDLALALSGLENPTKEQVELVLEQYGGFPVHASEHEQLLRNARFMTEWGREVGDKVFAFGQKMSNDPNYVPPYRAGFFTSTHASYREVSTLKDDIKRLETAIANIDPTDEASQAVKIRYAQALEAMHNRHAVAAAQAGKIEQRVSQLGNLIQLSGIVPTKKFMGTFFKKDTDLSISLHAREASKDYISGFSRKVIYDHALSTSHADLKGFLAEQARGGANMGATRGMAEWVTDYLLDQTGVRRTVQLNKMADRLSRFGKGQATVEGFKKGIQGIQTLHYILNLALKPAFYPMNLMQNFLTLFPLVDTESFSYGISRAMFDWKNAYKEASETGAVRPSLNHLWQEDAVGGGVKFLKSAQETLGWAAEKTETFNRVLAYHAGLKSAELSGLKGNQAIAKARDIVIESHFAYSPAYRPTITNTPGGSAFFRYRSFGQNYATFLAGLYRREEYGKLGAAVASMWALSGTAGIPFYSLVRTSAAQMGVNLPDVDPLDEVTGLQLGAAMSPLPIIPSDVDDFAGPVLGIGVNAAKLGGLALSGASSEMVKEQAARLTSQVIGGPINRAVTAFRESSRRGINRSPGGQELKTQRTPEQIAMSGLGLRRTPNQIAYHTRRDLEYATAAGDSAAVGDIMRKSSEEGLRNQQQILQRIRASRTRKGRTTLGGIMTGIN